MKNIMKYLPVLFTFIFLHVHVLAVAPSIEQIHSAIAGTEQFEEGEDERAFRLLDQYIDESYGNENLRQYIEAGLVAVLKSKASVASKQRVCNRLHLVGTNKSVDALSPLLRSGNTVLVEAACYALSSNPSESTSRALRDALSHSTGNGKVAIIHLLGELRADDCTMDLIALGDTSETLVQEAVYNTLGELANTPATEYLTGKLQSKDQRIRRLAGLALSEAAQQLADSAHSEMAEDIYDSLLNEKVPAFIRRGAYLGKISLTGFSDVEDVMQQIRGNDPTLAAAAMSLIPKLV
jgi:hypothetical protein